MGQENEGEKPVADLRSQGAPASVIASLAEKIIPGLPPALRGLLLAITLVQIIVVTAVGLFVLNDGLVYAFWLIIADFTFVSGSFRYMSGAAHNASQIENEDQKNEITSAKHESENSKQKLDEFFAGQARDEKWFREVPNIEKLDGGAKVALISRLEDIRSSAFSWLSKNEPGDPPLVDDIRANIFFANYQNPQSGDTCRLYMEPYLKLGMEGHKDENVTFRPGEGATGYVFLNEIPQWARFTPDDDGGGTWGESYPLTDKQKEAIHEDLRWVVSLPLHRNGISCTMAVLNIDCLRHEYPRTTLENLSYYLLDPVTKLSAELAKVPSVRLSICVEET